MYAVRVDLVERDRICTDGNESRVLPGLTHSEVGEGHAEPTNIDLVTLASMKIGDHVLAKARSVEDVSVRARAASQLVVSCLAEEPVVTGGSIQYILTRTAK